jgi:superfamily II DNA or RNA helicase
MRILQDMLTDLTFEELPPAWSTFDLATFSHSKRLWDYQQKALQYALKALWKYYEDFADHRDGEPLDTNLKRKDAFWQWYRDNGLEENLDISLDRQRGDIRRLLMDYYPAEDEVIPFRHFINRIGFWMATGSGKSLVLVKLLEILWHLMQRGEIPQNDILVLTAREDLLQQLKAHVAEFNASRGDFHVCLVDLKAYPDVKWGGSSLFHPQELTVFLYRSDNLSDEQKERIIDFRNYDNGGRWYILLDEAHKGDKEDSKRQHVYSILSRNGFLFNFSATFTDRRDILTTVYDFNLARFVETGYGKHIAILRQENRAFRDEEDYTGDEKQRVVLKALLMLAYARKAQEALPQYVSAYHRPLMLVLVNSVNIRDADLKLFFRELKRIGKERVEDTIWEQAKAELWQELSEPPELLFENARFVADRSLLNAITPEELLRLVYNAPALGEIEVLLRPSNRQEMAFKLKSAEHPFALIKIGDISNWLKEELEGYEVIEGYEDEGFFRRLNEEDSAINILMGSRTFYEGWDSNRPNVITYINIGTGTDARKFILQSVGRGVRIEPVSGQRKRLLPLYNAKIIDAETFRKLSDRVLPLETLLIFGTNRKALLTVIQELAQERRREAEHEIALEVNQEAVNDHPLLIPVYREADHTILQSRVPRKFEIADGELELLSHYISYLNDDRLLLTRHNATPASIRLLRQCLTESEKFFRSSDGRRYGCLDILLPRLFAYFQVVPQEVDRLKPLEDEIRHFKHIRVFLRDISELQEKIKSVRQAPYRIAELRAKYDAGIQLSFDEITLLGEQSNLMRKGETFTKNGQTLYIKRIAYHYYVPVLFSESEKIDHICHIIRHPSEVRFLNELERYLRQGGNAFQSLNWWAFSKIDETLDEVYIPYYDPNSNRIRRFYPDFIFWLRRGNDYVIVFVDPKGMQQTECQHKVDGFRDIFRDDAGQPKVLRFQGLTVRAFLLLFTEDVNRAPAGYREHWFDSPEAIPQLLA